MAHRPAQPPAAVPTPGFVPVAPAAPARPPWPGWASAGLYLLVFLTLMAVTQGGLGITMTFARLLSGRMVPPRGTVEDVTGLGVPLWASLMGGWGWFTLVVVLAVTAGLVRSLERSSLLDLGLRVRVTFWRDLVVGFGLAALLFVSVVGVGAGKGWYSIYNRVQAVDALVITLGGLFILLPFAAVEEIAVRGYLMKALGRSVGKWAAVGISSATFALLHSMNPGAWSQPLAMVGILLAGVYLASAYLITGSLWLPIFIHTGWNLLEGPVFGLPVSGIEPPVSILQASDTGPALWTGGRFGPEAGLLLCMMLGVHLAALWAMKPLLEPRDEAAERTETPVPVAAQVVGVGR